MACAIYAFDPHAASDEEFERGELRHLVAGNRGRLLDARRTPVKITAVAPEIGAFEVEVTGFEDVGARWELPLQDVGHFQFRQDHQGATREGLIELERAAARFDRELVVECESEARDETVGLIVAERHAVRQQIRPVIGSGINISRHIAGRGGEERLYELVEEIMATRGLLELEQRFSTAFVSNPRAGEFVKGHAIVLAELGLCPYRGKVVRNSETFAGRSSKQRRAQHLIARLAFTQELWTGLGCDTVTLYRGAAVEGPLPKGPASSFVSATFSRAVATAQFEGGPQTQTAVLWRQEIPVTRLVMTFLETRAMNLRFAEAEAVLLGDAGNQAF